MALRVQYSNHRLKSVMRTRIRKKSGVYLRVSNQVMNLVQWTPAHQKHLMVCGQGGVDAVLNVLKTYQREVKRLGKERVQTQIVMVMG